MRMDRNVRPELGAAPAKVRPTLAHPYLDVEAAALIATDSYVMVKVPVDIDEGDESGPIPTDALQAARKVAPRRLPIYIEANGAAVIPNYATFTRDQAYEFPNWRSIIETDPGKPVARFGVDAELLFRAQRALGARHLDVRFFDPLKALRVRPLGGFGEAVVMPVRLP